MLEYLYGKRFGSSQTFSRINTPTFSILVILHTYPPMKTEQTECSETSAYKIQTPGNHPEESIQRLPSCFFFVSMPKKIHKSQIHVHKIAAVTFNHYCSFSLLHIAYVLVPERKRRLYIYPRIEHHTMKM